MIANEGVAGMIDPTAHLWKKIQELENRIDINEKIIQKIKGLKMGEDFDFDNLLDDIETKTEVKEPETNELDDLDALLDTPIPTVVEDLEIPVDAVPEPTLDDLDDLLEETKETNVSETTETPEILSTKNTRANTATTQVSKINEEISFDTTGVEFAEEYVKYWKEINDLELRKKTANDAFKEELSVMKEEYTDAGVDIKSANYVRGTIIRRMKESQEESSLMDAVDKMLNKDTNLKDSFIPFVV